MDTCVSAVPNVRTPVFVPMTFLVVVAPYIFASRSQFETDTTAISIFEPPEPRVGHHYSTFVNISFCSGLFRPLLHMPLPMKLPMPNPPSMFLVRHLRQRGINRGLRVCTHNLLIIPLHP